LKKLKRSVTTIPPRAELAENPAQGEGGGIGTEEMTYISKAAIGAVTIAFIARNRALSED
jgi:4-hydroxy-L-threonine phosphate dehydrogenase PdxA